MPALHVNVVTAGTRSTSRSLLHLHISTYNILAILYSNLLYISLRTITGETHNIEDVDESWTVSQLKEHIADKVDCPTDRQKLVFAGRILADDQVLSDAST